MNFHIYCEISNFASASATFIGGRGRAVTGRDGIGFRGLTLKFEKGTVVGYGIY